MSSKIEFRYVYLSRLEVPYPPDDKFVADLVNILIRWEEHLRINPMSDKRTKGGKRPLTHLLDPTKLQYIVEKGESVIFFDVDDKSIVGVVIQGMIGDEEVVKNFNGLIYKHLNHAHLMRVDDPGKMASVGYTAGQLSDPGVSWSKNLKRSKLDTNSAEGAKHDYAMSCMFAHVWKRCLEVLPSEIIKDYDAAAERLGGIGMDAGAMAKGKELNSLRYTLNINGEKKEFEVSKLAPQSGSVAQNYCRYTHNETNENEYCVSWTANRSHPPEDGGNFYIASHGILIPGRSDQTVSWKGKNKHGTTLSNVDPVDPNPTFNQSGLAFILPKRIKISQASATWNKKGFAVDLTGDEEDDFLDAVLEYPLELEYADVKAKARAVMALRKEKDDTGVKKPYKKEMKAEYTFPAHHPYEDMKKKSLIEELKRRNLAGRAVEIHKWYSVNAMKYQLLKDDDVEVSVTFHHPPSKESGGHAGTEEGT